MSYRVARFCCFVWSISETIWHRYQFFNQISLFWKNESTSSPRCLCVHVRVCALCQLLNCWTYVYDTWYLYHDTGYFVNLSHQSVFLYVYPLLVARQRLGKNITAATNTHATIEELFDASFSVRCLSYQSRRLVPTRTFFIVLHVKEDPG
jgi:hypothetical protein